MFQGPLDPAAISLLSVQDPRSRKPNSQAFGVKRQRYLHIRLRCHWNTVERCCQNRPLFRSSVTIGSPHTSQNRSRITRSVIYSAEQLHDLAYCNRPLMSVFMHEIRGYKIRLFSARGHKDGVAAGATDIPVVPRPWTKHISQRKEHEVKIDGFHPAAVVGPQ